MPTPDASAGIEDEMAMKNSVDVLRPTPEVFERLSVGLDLPVLQEKKTSGKSLMQESWETLGEKDRLKIREDLARLESIQARTGLGLQAAPDQNWFKHNMESILGVRQSALATILTGMRRTYSPEASAFIDSTTENPKDDIAKTVQDLEEYAWNPPDWEDSGSPNPLYVRDRGNNRFTPNFPALQEKQGILRGILLNGIRSDDPKKEKLTRERVERLQSHLRLIEDMNPINKQIYLAKQDPGLLSKPLKLAAFGSAAVLGVLSLIPILKKLAHGEDLALSDWPAAVWPVLTAYLGGFVPGASKKQLETYAQANIAVQGNERFRNVVAKMGGKVFAQDAVREIHDLLQEPDKRKILKGALAKRKIPIEFLQSFTEKTDPKDSPLLKALSNTALSDEDRYVFLGTLYDLKITKEENLDAMIAALNKA